MKATNITMASNKSDRHLDSESKDLSDDLATDQQDDLRDDGRQDLGGEQQDESLGDEAQSNLNDEQHDENDDVRSTDDSHEDSPATVFNGQSDRKRSKQKLLNGAERSERHDAITGSSESSSDKEGKSGYQFDHQGDLVSNLRRVRGGVSRSERIEKGEAWSFDGVNLIQTEQTRLGLEVSTYADGDGDSVFTRIRESFTPFSGGGAPLN